jgi:aryl-alcohol dehydrogenase-like predicted oxidoreductase
MRYQQMTEIKPPHSSICLGTANFGSQTPVDLAFALLDRFVELGGNFLDTAHIYGAWDKNGVNGGVGNSERVIGQWMRARNCRDGVVVGTKGGHPDFETGESGLTRETVLRHLEESLDHLQTDHVDIYWLHRDDRNIPVAEILEWLREPVEAGIIRALGCSHWRADRLAEAVAIAEKKGLPRVQASQIAWSLAQVARTITGGKYGEQLAMDEATWRFHRETGLPLAAYNSQAAGFFAAKYDGLDMSAADFPKPMLARKYAGETNKRRREQARQIAKEKGRSANQIAVAWLLAQPFPVTAIVGPRDIPQLEDSMPAADIALSPEEAHTLGAF